MKNVKIVFTDFDSTLTKENGIVDIKNKVIFERLADIGIPVVINTGRPLNYIVPKCKQLCTSNYVIASNGAEVYNFKNDNESGLLTRAIKEIFQRIEYNNNFSVKISVYQI